MFQTYNFSNIYVNDKSIEPTLFIIYIFFFEKTIKILLTIMLNEETKLS